MNDLISDCERMINVQLDNESFWWHLNENELSYPAYQNKIPDCILDELKIIMGKLGLVFLNHDFIKIDIESSSKNSSDYFMVNGVSQYRFAFLDTDTLSKVMQEYGKLHEKAKSILERIEKIKLDKKKNSIGEIWDSM